MTNKKIMKFYISYGFQCKLYNQVFLEIILFRNDDAEINKIFYNQIITNLVCIFLLNIVYLITQKFLLHKIFSFVLSMK